LQRTEIRSAFSESLAFVPPCEVNFRLTFEKLPEDLPVLANYTEKTYPR
jgi:hypothetical protein